MPHQVGYCCINMTLSKQKITTGRTMRRDTFLQKGIAHASALALQNSSDLVKIIRWNYDNDIRVFRMSSNLFPWNSEYKLSDLPDYDKIVENLRNAGDIAKATKQRITAHPDHFVKLGSASDSVALNSIHDLNHHAEVFDLMRLDQNHNNCINIHVGMNYNDDVIHRFIKRFDMLSDSVKSRLVVENDDKENGFSIRQLHKKIYSEIGTPLTFDYFHHTFHSDGLSSNDAAHLAASTWKVKPLFHYSESKALNENLSVNPRAHSDYVFNKIDDFGLRIDIDLEAKAKELAVLTYREKHL